jgi:adenosine/AMP kinase
VNALAIGAGHSFVIMLREGFPVYVVNPVKAVPEVCASANPPDVLVAVTDRGHGVLAVVDGPPPVGIKANADAASRHRLLRDIGYKLCRRHLPERRT